MTTVERADGRRETATERVGALGDSMRDRCLRAGLEALARVNALWRLNFSIRGHIGERGVVVPLVRGEGIQLVRGDERWMFDLLRGVLRQRAGAFIDVGANLGQTLLKVKAIDPDRVYYGFEPNPSAVSYCRELVRVNTFAHATIVPVGLSSGTDVVMLFAKAETDPSASLVAGFRRASRYSGAQPVSVHTGDAVLERLEIADVAVIKIDVEGAELDVLAGFTRTLTRHRPVVLCEVLPVYDVESPEGRLRLGRQQQLVQLLQATSYAIWRVESAGELSRVPDFGVHADIRQSNYLFAPLEARPTAD